MLSVPKTESEIYSTFMWTRPHIYQGVIKDQSSIDIFSDEQTVKSNIRPAGHRQIKIKLNCSLKKLFIQVCIS